MFDRVQMLSNSKLFGRQTVFDVSSDNPNLGHENSIMLNLIQ